MSGSGLEVFDSTVQQTNIWLNEIMEEVGPDKHRAYHALKSVLHALRDRLTVGEAVSLGAQLPVLVRGIYYESWRPSENPHRERHMDEFLARISAELNRSNDPMDPGQAARVVFKVLAEHIDKGGVQGVMRQLPDELKTLFPSGWGNA